MPDKPSTAEPREIARYWRYSQCTMTKHIIAQQPNTAHKKGQLSAILGSKQGLTCVSSTCPVRRGALQPITSQEWKDVFSKTQIAQNYNINNYLGILSVAFRAENSGYLIWKYFPSFQINTLSKKYVFPNLYPNTIFLLYSPHSILYLKYMFMYLFPVFYQMPVSGMECNIQQVQDKDLLRRIHVSNLGGYTPLWKDHQCKRTICYVTIL